LRFDGLFDNQADAMALGAELQGLGLCGPAGGGGYTFGLKPDLRITKYLIPRENVKYEVTMVQSHSAVLTPFVQLPTKQQANDIVTMNGHLIDYMHDTNWKPPIVPPVAPTGLSLLYHVAHSRSGDKGDTANVSVIPYNREDLPRLQTVITVDWVKRIFKTLLGEDPIVIVYTMPGISALNITLNPVLDGGVSVSRRIDRHGKCLSDLILNQWVDLPPPSSHLDPKL